MHSLLLNKRGAIAGLQSTQNSKPDMPTLLKIQEHAEDLINGIKTCFLN